MSYTTTTKLAALTTAVVAMALIVLQTKSPSPDTYPQNTQSSIWTSTKTTSVLVAVLLLGLLVLVVEFTAKSPLPSAAVETIAELGGDVRGAAMDAYYGPRRYEMATM
jgi:hypothetical protein